MRLAKVRTYGSQLLVVALVASSLSLPRPSLAQETSAELQQRANTMAASVEQTTVAYYDAINEVESINALIAENETHVAEIEEALPAQRARTAASVKNLYLLQQSSFSSLSLIFSSKSFDELISTIRYIDAIHEHNLNEVNSLVSLESELAQTRAQLSVERAEAQAREEQALAALEQARAARNELQARALAMAHQESQARDAAIAAAQKAVDSASASADQQPATFTTTSGNVAEVQVPAQPNVSTEPLTSNVTADEAGDWAARIDAYLAGSPLEGYGATFAEAAAAYGVDPRLSPAIATIESGRGANCFRDHNAWGWGSSGWSDWETAIYEQVEGLANGYDGTLTLDGAQRYCPPNYEQWYSSVATEMDSI